MKNSKKHFQAVFDNMSNAFAFLRVIIDETGKPVDYEFLEVNQAFEELGGVKRDHLIGKRLRTIDFGAAWQGFDWVHFLDQTAQSGRSAATEGRCGILNEWYLIETFAPEPGYMATFFIDISNTGKREMKSAAKNVKLSRACAEEAATGEEMEQRPGEMASEAVHELNEARYKTLIDNSHDVIYSCDCDGVFTAFNRRLCEAAKLPAEKIIGRKITDIFADNVLDAKWREAMFRAIATKRTVSLEARFLAPDGTVRYYEITYAPIFDSQGEVIGVIGNNHDITGFRNNEMKIIHMAYHDALTDLPNRTLFLDRLKTAIAACKRNQTKVAVAFLDLDNFKKVNDSLGHAVGDRLLVKASRRLRARLREGDTLSRFSGDEFSIILLDIKGFQELYAVSKRILAIFEEPFIIDDNSIHLTVSIGIATYPDDGDNADELIKHADTAMYKAKELGKNGYQLFNVTMKDELMRKLLIEQMLRRAIANQEFVLHYQPQFEVSSRTLRGFEALIRWNNPEMGFLSPMEFIPVAEETGLIIPIGKWVLEEAALLAKQLQLEHGADLIISVNISPIQLRQKDFYQLVTAALERAGLSPDRLELEVTENIFIDNYENAVNVLTRLKEAGVRIALDDFGTGYSSLSYLKNLPIHVLKIDKSFIREIPSDLHQNMCESIISLVHKLHIETIAEGIESQEQLDYLRRAKCDYLQGYFLGRPAPAEKLGPFLGKENAAGL